MTTVISLLSDCLVALKSRHSENQLLTYGCCESIKEEEFSQSQPTVKSWVLERKDFLKDSGSFSQHRELFRECWQLELKLKTKGADVAMGGFCACHSDTADP